MTDIEIPTLRDQIEALASPDPASTNWVPLYNLLNSATVQSGYSARVARTTGPQVIPSGAWTTVTFDTLRWDKGGQWNAGQPTRLTCQLAGSYLVYHHLQFVGANGGNNRLGKLLKNGSIDVTSGGLGGVASNTGGYPVMPGATILDLVPGDFIAAQVYQDSGGNVNLNNSDPSSNWASCDMGMAFLGGPQGPPGPAGAGTPGYGTSLPGSPADGQEYVLVDSVSNPSYQWRFRYNAGSSSAYKWEFVGGAPMQALVWIDETLPNDTSWHNFPTVVQLSTPRTGVYDIAGQARFFTTSVSTRAVLGLSIAGGSQIETGHQYGSDARMVPFQWPQTALTVGQSVAMQYYFQAAPGAGAYVHFKLLSLLPRRVS